MESGLPAKEFMISMSTVRRCVRLQVSTRTRITYTSTHRPRDSYYNHMVVLGGGGG